MSSVTSLSLPLFPVLQETWWKPMQFHKDTNIVFLYLRGDLKYELGLPLRFFRENCSTQPPTPPPPSH